jgi:hypothetical protein
MDPSAGDTTGGQMPRYLVERGFPEGLNIPATNEGAAALRSVVATNAEDGVTWIQSFVTEDHRKTYCIYDAPELDAIRRVAERNGLPHDAIVPVQVLDPYFYH